MFSIICTMLAGIVIGRFLHDGKFLKISRRALRSPSLPYCLCWGCPSAPTASSWKIWGAWDGRQPYWPY